ncbi:hypothetical protein [Paractinoplanes toevensis]|uniref:Uncharacterized protein n=1 Tax=Paractinoplanes toevensis TaxID=571911 RepID=A0A919T617_9ACTN|nr:hypothetical protein [Actinoplanes toevensis]GIM89828.1 hypothetical protein Ato02nite_016210 [Actinoplanes toevensis]
MSQPAEVATTYDWERLNAQLGVLSMDVEDLWEQITDPDRQRETEEPVAEESDADRDGLDRGDVLAAMAVVVRYLYQRDLDADRDHTPSEEEPVPAEELDRDHDRDAELEEERRRRLDYETDGDLDGDYDPTPDEPDLDG